jgi:hypothetical protein
MASCARAAALVLALAQVQVASAQSRPFTLGASHVSISTTQMSSSKSGYNTYQVGVNFDSALVEDVYALFGEDGSTMVIPPAFQVAAPFGTDVGPVRTLCPLRRTLRRTQHRAANVDLLTHCGCLAGQPGFLPNDAGLRVRLVPHHRPGWASTHPRHAQHSRNGPG